MNYKNELGSTIVTGGAGFIGSQVVDSLIDLDVEVKVLDDLSSGSTDNLLKNQGNEKFHFKEIDIRSPEVSKEFNKNIKTVFHLAADPEVRTGFEFPKISYEKNILSTLDLLEQIRKSNVETILFTSSSVVYGEPDVIPTPEDYGPLLPISHYGSSKLACEALISSYCHNYGIKSQIFRLANVIGIRSNHGVIWDFINKLRKNPDKLEVLGDGQQAKSYLHVSDCVDCFLFCLSNMKKQVEIFNIGNYDKVNVMFIADTVCKSLGLKNVKTETTGGIDNGRGWPGDVKIMQLEIEKLKKLGWSPKYSSVEAVQLASNELIQETK